MARLMSASSGQGQPVFVADLDRSVG